MKKTKVERIIALMAIAAMAASMTACGAKEVSKSMD